MMINLANEEGEIELNVDMNIEMVSLNVHYNKKQMTCMMNWKKNVLATSTETKFNKTDKSGSMLPGRYTL